MKNILGNAKRIVLLMTIILTIFTGIALADDVNIRMEGSTATIPKGNTVTRKIIGIPKIEGTVKLKFKWHAVHIIPNTFNALKVVFKHGTTTLKTQNSCFSNHSNKTPKCNFDLNISRAEAEKTANWTLEVTNNSGEEVISFDIEKGSDINPAVPNFKSVYSPNCPNTKNLDMEGTTATITKGGTVTRKIYGISDAPGTLTLKLKWHAVHIVPNTFNQLKIDVYDTKGNRVSALSGNFYSFHGNRTPKYDKTYQIIDANLGGNQGWKIVVTNNSDYEVVDFNIEKGSDIIPTVPAFRSTYKQSCP